MGWGPSNDGNKRIFISKGFVLYRICTIWSNMHNMQNMHTTLTAGCNAMCMGGECMCVPTSETYAEVLNLGVKVQGGVGSWWYVTVYTSISHYMAGYTSIMDAWSAHWFCHFWLQESMWSAWGINACMHKHQTDTLKYEKSRCSWLCVYTVMYSHMTHIILTNCHMTSYDSMSWSILIQVVRITDVCKWTSWCTICKIWSNMQNK
jgi:hypothetical protein